MKRKTLAELGPAWNLDRSPIDGQGDQEETIDRARLNSLVTIDETGMQRTVELLIYWFTSQTEIQCPPKTQLEGFPIGTLSLTSRNKASLRL